MKYENTLESLGNKMAKSRMMETIQEVKVKSGCFAKMEL